MSGSHRIAALALAFLLAALPVAPRAALAADPIAAQTHEQAMKVPAGKFVQDLGDKAIVLIANKQLSPEQRSTEFSKILGDSFDLKTIGRYVIGRTWASATPEQQQEYMDLFRSLVIRNYGSRMSLYAGEGFSVVGTRPESDMDTVVQSHITHPDGSKPTQIEWRIREKDGKIGVIDVSVENVSLSLTQRQEYASVIQRNGGAIDGLLKQMRQELSAETKQAAPKG